MQVNEENPDTAKWNNSKKNKNELASVVRTKLYENSSKNLLWVEFFSKVPLLLFEKLREKS